MTRVKRGTISMKRRRNVLRQTKGFKWGGKSKERSARERLLHAGIHSFNDRRKKKGNFRKLWNIRINAAAREHGLNYSKLIGLLNKKGVKLNRKVLSELAVRHPESFQKIIESLK